VAAEWREQLEARASGIDPPGCDASSADTHTLVCPPPLMVGPLVGMLLGRACLGLTTRTHARTHVRTHAAAAAAVP
jgi:hypothetical protein